ncbi:MAG: hypothetical protein EOP54_17940 [Sphingobacteriales bacterium]|nr:MAG: hypothetical protein EOP54_17940 [Sphingobacteriales bacterium]
MLIRWRVPKTIQWLVKLFLIYLFIFTAFRVATVICFKPKNIAVYELGSSFWLGLKYDLRWISFILLPIAVISLFPKLSPFYSERLKKIWTGYLGIITLLVLFFYGADFGQFAYINARLNADALIFAEDPQESLQMVWQSYPVIWILIGLIGAVLMMVWMFRRTHVGVEGKNVNVHKFTYRRRWHAAALLLLGWFMASYTNSTVPYADGFCTSVSFVAQILLTRKVLQNWLLWVFVDICYIPLFIYKHLNLSAVLYFVLIAIAYKGYLDWRKTYREQLN